MKRLQFLLVALILIGCSSRKPLVHEQITANYPNQEVKQLRADLINIINSYNMTINQKKSSRTHLETDSFDVNEKYCDCGLNMVGNEYPGNRQGVLKISLNHHNGVNLKFDFKTKLIITGNNKKVICNSHGLLEKEILMKLEEQFKSRNNN